VLHVQGGRQGVMVEGGLQQLEGKRQGQGMPPSTAEEGLVLTARQGVGLRSCLIVRIARLLAA
jgi:hypothetical protein